MKISNRSFPYPVLAAGRDDVLTGKFEVAESVRSDPAFYYLDMKATLAHPTLAEMISNGSAQFGVHVEAVGGFYRRLFTFTGSDLAVSIPSEEVEGTVQVCTFVLSKAASTTYCIAGAHGDYGNASFPIRAGDVLAIGKCFNFEAIKELDPLKRVSSILQVLCDKDNKDGPFTLGLDTEKITIYMSVADHKAYAVNKSDARVNAILVQGLVVPALTQAIIYLSHRIETDDPPARWESNLKKRLTALGTNQQKMKDEPLVCVQQLLGHPTRRFLKEVSAIAEGDNHAA